MSNTAYSDHLTCSICLEVLQEPVQCIRNEHYFCTKCITKHLKRSQTCPECQDELTPETLRPIPRIVANILEQFQSVKCKYVNRGCTSAVRYESLLSHLEECGFAPVQCPYDGCNDTVNRKDLVGHQENCEFRSVTCNDCHKAMKQRDYEKHGCILRKKVDENKQGLAEVKKILQEIQDEQRRQGEEMQRIAKQLNQTHATQRRQSDNSTVSMPQLGYGAEKQSDNSTISEPQLGAEKQCDDSVKVRASESTTNAKQITRQRTSQIRQPKAVQIIVAGGRKKSYEVFNWSTQKWTLYKDTLFFTHTDATAFVYDNKILICGGIDTNRIECLDIANDRLSTTLYLHTQLLDHRVKGVLCDDKILTFGKSVSAASLKPPFKTTVMAPFSENEKMSGYGVARINENAVVVVGGTKGDNQFTTRNVLLYNLTKNSFKKLAPLPYGVADMALLVYKDNLVIVGGRRSLYEVRFPESETLNSVLMYNITNQKCRKLPDMMEKRSRCAATIMGNTIVVMGGVCLNRRRQDIYLKTAEYLVLGENTWKILPEMHHERDGASACIQP